MALALFKGSAHTHRAALPSPVRLDLLGEVPLDPAVREAVQRRQLLMEALPGTPAALALLNAVNRVPGA